MKSRDVENTTIRSQLDILWMHTICSWFCVQTFAHIKLVQHSLHNVKWAILCEGNLSIQSEMVKFGQNIQVLATDNTNMLRVSPKTHVLIEFFVRFDRQLMMFKEYSSILKTWNFGEMKGRHLTLTKIWLC